MFAVIFEVQPRPEAWDDYLGHATALRPELLQIDGFLDNERFASRTRPGWLVSLSLWRNEKALIRWRTHAGHHLVQGQGRTTVFADYRLRVGEVTEDSAAAAPLEQQRLDETEVSAAHAVSLTEPPGEPPTPDPAAIEADAFESITRPGAFLLLQAWPDTPLASAGTATLAGRTRIVRVIRDYGRFRRAEAPQYFPPVTRE
jgi:heme-degrading monooxygenase HmoA